MRADDLIRVLQRVDPSTQVCLAGRHISEIDGGEVVHLRPADRYWYQRPVRVAVTIIYGIT